MHELHNNLFPAVALNFGQKTATGNGNIIDLQGYDSIEFMVVTGAVATASAGNQLDFTVYEGDDSGLSDAALVSDATRLIGSNMSVALTSQANTVQKQGVVVSTKRYMRLTMTETGTADATLGALAIRGHKRNAS